MREHRCRKRWLLWWLLGGVVLVIPGCSPPGPGPIRKALTSHEDWASVTKLGCYRPDTCPAYELVVYKSGEVRWHGSQCVRKKGRRQARISAAHATRLLDELDAGGVKSLPSGFHLDCTAHMGVTTIRYHRGGEWRRSELVHFACTEEPNFVNAMILARKITNVARDKGWLCDDARCCGGENR